MVTPASSFGQLKRDIEAQITALDGTITETRSRLSSLQLQRAALVSELDQLRDPSTPIHTLPPEILSEIFRYFQPYFPASPVDEESKESAHIPWFLGLVCRSWREVAIGLQELWSVLDIDDTPRAMRSPIWTGYDDEVGYSYSRPQDRLTYVLDNEFEDEFEAELQRLPESPTPEDVEGFFIEYRLEIVKTCLERARTHGLSLRLQSITTLASTFVLDLLLQHSRHWEQVSLVNPSDSICDQIQSPEQRFPRLRRLTVEGQQWHNTYNQSRLSALGPLLHGSRAPRFTEIGLINLTMAENFASIRWSGLEKYSEVDCNIAPRHRVDILRQLANLVSLTIKTDSTFMWTEHVFFPHLRHASFALVQYSQHSTIEGPFTLEMPNLEDFSLHASRIRSFGGCVPQSSRQLRKLSVSLMSVDVYQGDAEQVFALFPKLEDLSLWGSNYLTDGTLESLTPGPQRPYLLPCLETLRLSSTAFAHGECKWTTLLNMVQGRLGPLATTTALIRLRSLEYVCDARGHDDEVAKGLQTLQRQRGWDIRVRTSNHRSVWTESGIQWLHTWGTGNGGW